MAIKAAQQMIMASAHGETFTRMPRRLEAKVQRQARTAHDRGAKVSGERIEGTTGSIQVCLPELLLGAVGEGVLEVGLVAHGAQHEVAKDPQKDSERA